MITLTIILLVALLVTNAVAGVFAWRLHRTTPATWFEDRARTRLRIHTLKGPTIEGLVESVDDDGLVLHLATFMAEGGGEFDLDGTTWVPRDQVLFVQQLPSS